MEECYYSECKYYEMIFEKINGEWDRCPYCHKKEQWISDEEEICNYFEKSQKCFNCKHSCLIVYETGTIDSIDYHCKLQNEKMIYSDITPYYDHYASFPDCPINKWEKIR